MAGSLAVFKLIDLEKEKLLKNELNSNPQHTFSDLDLADSLGQARSILKFIDYDENANRINYKSTHYSETITNKIRIYLDDLEDTFFGLNSDDIEKIKTGTKILDEYQEIYKFDVVIDLNTKEIFVFTKKNVAHSFMRRFKKSGLINYEKMLFDMSNIENVPELSNIWGLWEDCNGRCTKKAYFGTEVHRLEGLDKKNVSTYNVKYEVDDGNIVDFFIMVDCRLSSRSRIINNGELFETYQEIKTHLLPSNSGYDVTEVYPEED